MAHSEDIFEDSTDINREGDQLELEAKSQQELEAKSQQVKEYNRKDPVRVVWKNVILMSYLHLSSAYALTRIIHCHPYTLVFASVTWVLSGLGITAGAHRLWTHRSYKAKLPLRILLMLCNTLALQNSIYEWSRDHRTHHKFSETDADPHNAKRGFFFSHVGWLLVRKHPDVLRKGKSIPLGDLESDPVVTFQRKFYIPMALSLCFVLPSVLPWYFWGESLWNAYFVTLLRYCTVLNVTWTVNSLAHMYGNRPYDRTIHPSENVFVAFTAMGEGYHNYHHTFPSDYATSEFGWRLNLTTAFIDLMALIGQVTDRRVTPKSMIGGRKKRTGEHSDLPLARR